MIQRLAGVYLDAAEAEYIARALEEFAKLMTSRGSRHLPSPRLQSVTAKLRRTVDSLAISDPAADQGQSGRTTSKPPDARARQRISVHAGPHVMGTGQAARILGVTPNGVRDLRRRGVLTAHHTGTRWQYESASVVALAERRAAQRGR